MQPNYGLNATFAAANALKGNIAFASQSGAMCTAALDWALREKIGFSSFVSVGSMADVHWGDIIDHLGSDPNTESILIYMETIGNAAAFLSAAKEVAEHKPIIVIKAGKSEKAAKAAASHTGSLAGSNDAYLAAMRRVGVMTVDTIAELFHCARALGKQNRPQGPNLMIITNAGGPGVLATDAASLHGADVVELQQSTKDKLAPFMPSAWSNSNPVDILGDAPAALYGETLAAVLDEPYVDGFLVILSPQSVTESTETARALLEAVKGKNTKTVMASWMGGVEVAVGRKMLNDGGIPAYEYPDAAARTFSKIWKNTRDISLMKEIPGLDVSTCAPVGACEAAMRIISEVRSQDRLLLTEAESKRLLKTFDIPVAETLICESEEDACTAGHSVGFPCVVKLHSEFITHKSDVGGVKLNIMSTDAIRDAWLAIKASVDKINPDHFQGVTVQPMIDLNSAIELIFGSFIDPQFGQLVAFGFGGKMVEIFKDSALALPPLNASLAERQVKETKIFAALQGGHGERFPGVPLDELYRQLVNFSLMISTLNHELEEVDINPLVALRDRFLALDARVILKAKADEDTLVAIRPYPHNYIYSNVKLNDGTCVTIRPCHPGDVKSLRSFHNCLSQHTLKQRFLADVTIDCNIVKQKLSSVCFADYNRVIALVVVDEENTILAICRIVRFATRHEEAEVRMAVEDTVQRKGLGTKLINITLEIAKHEKISRLIAPVLEANSGFLKIAQRAGFTIGPSDDCGIHQVSFEL